MSAVGRTRRLIKASSLPDSYSICFQCVCVYKKAISGDAFDATTILLDETLRRVRIDLLRDNMLRAERSGGREPPLPDPTYLWGITPFKSDSRMTQSLTRRGFHFLEVRGVYRACPFLFRVQKHR